MQERRTTLRVTYACPGHYCSANDLLPRTGRVTNLSERGAGLLLREVPHRADEVTVTFPLPGETDSVSATGVVRWASSQRLPWRGYPVGVEWFPLEEEVRHRLSRALYRSTQRRSPRLLRWGILLVAVMIGVLGSLAIGWRGWALFEENRRLHTEAAGRMRVIQRLEHEAARLQGELVMATSQLANTAEHVAALDRQATELDDQIQHLREDMKGADEAYLQVRAERERLIEHVMNLEQQRAVLARRRVPSHELRQAIREAIAARRRTRGNRGYVIHTGEREHAHPVVRIRVHEPVPSP